MKRPLGGHGSDSSGPVPVVCTRYTVAVRTTRAGDVQDERSEEEEAHPWDWAGPPL